MYIKMHFYTYTSTCFHLGVDGLNYSPKKRSDPFVKFVKKRQAQTCRRRVHSKCGKVCTYGLSIYGEISRT